MSGPGSRWYYTRRIVRFALCGLLLWCAGCAARRSQQYTEQGETYLLIGNVEQAKASFIQAAELDPMNARSKLGLARCYWFEKKVGEAVDAYKEALAIDPHLGKAYLESTRIYLATKDTKGAEAMARMYEIVDPVEGGILHAYVFRETGRVAQAVDLLTDLQEQQPKSVEVRVNLAASYLAAGQPDTAEKVLDTALSELDESSLPARILLIEAYKAQGKLDRIVEQLRALVAEQPKNQNLQLALARSLVDSKQTDEAESIARSILEKSPESPWANYVVGACLVQKGKYPEAVECLSAAFGALPQEPAVAQMLSIAQQGGKGQPGETKTPVTSQTAGVAPPPGETWRDLWADAAMRALLKNRDAFLAQEDTTELQETLVLAAIFSQNVALARELSAKLPEGSPVKLYLEALLSGKPDDLKPVFDSWNESLRDRQIMRANAMGFALALTGARGQALDTFSGCLQSFPEHGVALYNIVSMYQSAGMPRFAVAGLKQLIARHGRNQEARELLFDILSQAELTSEARQLAESTYAMFPKESFASIMLVRTYRDSGETGLAVDVLKRGIERTPGAPELSAALVEILLYTEQVDEAKRTLDTIADPGDAKPQIALLSAFCAAAKGDWAEVLRLCQEQNAATYPVPFRLLHTAALLREGKSNEAAGPLLSADGTPIASPSTNVLLDVFGKLPGEAAPDDTSLASALKGKNEEIAVLAYAMACREVRFSRTAARLFADLDAKAPAKPRLVAFLLSSIAQSSGAADRIQAVRHYTEEYPAMAAAWIGLAGVERALGNTDGERAALEKAVEVQPDHVEAWLAYAQFLNQKSETGKLLEVYRRLVRLLPDDPYVANNLAYCILETNGDTAEALQLAERAAQKAKLNPEIVHTLGLAQFRAGKVDDGAKNLSIALEMRPGDPTLLLDMGKVLVAQNKAEQGRRYIQLAVHYTTQLGLEFPRRAEAEQILAQS